MDNTKFLHIGDIHFDSKLIGLDEQKRNIRQYETFETLKRVLNENSDCDFVFFTGDIFDGEYNKSTVIKLCKLFEQYSEKQFFISLGNHDYLLCDTAKNLISTIPKNVHIFSDKIACLEYETYGLRIYGCSFSTPHVHSSLLENFKAKEDNLVNIMLLHGDVSGVGSYNPINTKDISDSNLDYLALGHKHVFSEIMQINKTRYAYPGILEPRGFDECGICGVIKGNIINSQVELEFLPANARCYEIIDFDVTNIATENELIEKLNAFLDKNNLYRINLVGTKCEELEINIDFLETIVDVFYCEIFDSTSSDVDIFMYSKENSLRGKTAQILQEYIENNIFNDISLQENVIKILTELLCKDGND